MGRITDAVKHLIIINVLFFVATQLYGDAMHRWFSLWFIENENFEWWQIISHMFMHGGISHILFNMFTLWMFGTSLERIWGKEKFIFFYLSVGLGAVFVQLGVNYYQFNSGIQSLVDTGLIKSEILETLSQGKYSPSWYDMAPRNAVESFIREYRTISFGASGATSGIMVAFAFMFPNMELMMLFFPVPIKAKYFIPVMFLGDLYYGFSGVSSGVGHFAHIGGALFGFLMMWYWKKKEFNKNRWN